MPKSPTMNRTGTRAAADLLEEMLATDDLATNDEPVPGPTADEMRQSSIEEAEPVGSHTDQPVEPAKAMLFDALGGRLAYERGGARLYEAILRKAEAVGHLQGFKDCIPDLEHIHNEEVLHAELLKRVITALGGDPTIETPCADVEGVMSSGLLQVVNDPRTTLLECLRAAVVAELADVENWASLAEKVRAQASADLTGEVDEALRHEREHLAMVRKWILAGETPALSRSARKQN